MLDNNNHNNKNCAFAEQTVSYLYGETEAQEKTFFEAHLKSCRNCADEFAGFNMVHSSVVEWRNEEFLHLELPLIEIPSQETRRFYDLDKSSPVSHSRLAQLRNFFTISPSLTASASFALLVFCIGAIFFATKSLNNTEIVGSKINSGNEITSPLFAEENLPNKHPIAAKPVAAENDEQANLDSRDFKKNTIIKTTGISANNLRNTNQPAKQRKVRANNNENKTQTFASAGKVPRLYDVEETEDKSLRLAELLGDGDSL